MENLMETNKDFFGTAKKQEELFQILRSWEGTPYRHKTGVKQRGVDCIHFVALVMVEVGVLKESDFTIPDYPSDWHLHRGEELLRESIDKFPFTWEFDPKIIQPKNGDILLYKYGRASSHSTIFFNGYIWQAVGNDTVRKNSIKLHEKRLTIGFRIKLQ